MREPPVPTQIRDHLNGAGRVFVSRGLAPAYRADLLERATELPCVRGVAVLPGDLTRDDIVVIGHPNWLGCFDPAPVHARSIVVTEPRLGAHKPLPTGDVVVVGANADPERAAAGLLRARKLARHLNQVPGVTPAYGTPQSAVFVVLAPVAPESIAPRLPGPAMAVSDSYPELPGGVRLDVSGVADPDVAAYAATMEDAVRSQRG